ncbi:MAG: CbiX/SirB N-terminal domain-containing protein [Aquincola sp.]|nr:CbiX/SirB N-terminal domain-containing protein [Aquincola sp.]MDH4290330.1 CbiX/SirB N-terminal domain-containing protein [Aquincola sp.]MDH5329052.1 CbiX/SirB N-terminal domain-containing protein [Aquincola sp.]
MSNGLVLFAHGARDPRWADPFHAIVAAVRARQPGLAVRLAYLEIMAPDLGSAVDALVAEGCTRIDVVPLFLGTGGHLRRDLPPLVDQAAARHSGVVVTLHRAAGEAPAVITALADHAIAVSTE